jgi:surface antigen
MSVLRKSASVLLVVSMLGACSSNNQDDGMGIKTIGGAALGAAGGGLLASAVGGGGAAIAAGVLLGGLLGGSVGSMLDDQDRKAAAATTQKSLETAPTGQTVAWSNPDNGHSGTVTPTKTFKNTAGQDCREFSQTVSVGGKEEQAYGTACRDAAGNWKIVQ